MQADQNNYEPDKQFTDQGWNEMLKTLDQEMPVQEKKRRGFFWLFPFLLVGVVASVWAFYPENKKVEIVQSQEVVFDQNQNSEIIVESNLEIINKNIATENQTTETNNPPVGNNKAKNDDGFPSVIESSNPLLPQVIEVIVPVEKTKLIGQKEPLARLEKEVQLINPNFITIELQKQEELAIEEKEFLFEEETIVKNPNPTKRKTEFGVFAGVVADFANVKKVGLTGGGFVHFPIGNKLGLRTGLGYALLQKELPYSFVGNQDALLSPEFLLNISTATPPFSTVAVQSNSDFILEKFHQLDVPILLTYSPVKKMQIQLGANVSYLVKAKTRLINNSININQAVNDDYSNYGIELDALDLSSISQNQYSDENYWTKLNVSGVAGLAWKPTRRINLELQYHHGFFPILKSNSNSGTALVGGTTVRNYEVYDNSGVLFDPLVNIPNSSAESFGKQLFSNEKFIKYNYSLRFTIGYNF
jgi:hypothetical protein